MKISLEFLGYASIHVVVLIRVMGVIKIMITIMMILLLLERCRGFVGIVL